MRSQRHVDRKDTKGTRARRPASRASISGRSPLEIYGRALGLTTQDLGRLGVSQVYVSGEPVLKIIHDKAAGAAGARFFDVRTGLASWRDNKEASIFGERLLVTGQGDEPLLLCRNEHEAIVLQHQGFQAVAIHDWSRPLAALDRDASRAIFALVSDSSHDTFLRWNERLPARSRLISIEAMALPWSKGASPAQFVGRLREAIEQAPTLAELSAEDDRARREQLWASCKDIASSRNVLDDYVLALKKANVVNVDAQAKLLYLALTSRLLPEPVSVAVRAVSAAGKSYLVKKSLLFQPRSAYLSVSAMSERALVNLPQTALQRRVLVIAEIEGIDRPFVEYIIRTLLSEHRVSYLVPVPDPDGGHTSEEKILDGPTGLLVTHTRTRLHPENETRVLPVTVPDTRSHTAAIKTAIADRASGRVSEVSEAVLQPWRDFGEWLALDVPRVVVPFIDALDGLTSDDAVRVRRDFDKLVGLISAHALLHRQSRRTDDQGRLLATVRDYAAVRPLVAEAMAEAIGDAVTPAVREAVDAVVTLTAGKPDHSVTVGQAAEALEIDQEAALRRVRDALRLGYLVDTRPGEKGPHQLRTGRQMPSDIQFLPTVAELRVEMRRWQELLDEQAPPPSRPGRQGRSTRRRTGR